MIFTGIQEAYQAAIAVHPFFSAQAATTVLIDLGNVTQAIESALAYPAGAGYAVAVWPPTKGSATDDGGDVGLIHAQSVIRLAVNPLYLTALNTAHAGNNALPTASQWVREAIESIVQALKGIAPSDGNPEKIMMATDFFELMNLDEGLLAFHLRFVCLAVMGDSNS